MGCWLKPWTAPENFVFFEALMGVGIVKDKGGGGLGEGVVGIVKDKGGGGLGEGAKGRRAKDEK